ncbi:MAG: hypothetical protein COW00_03735 [Bdellovibrio sp. CG12_big_fil_rev_8_21_14_0_65_39_13]|nr:MAG: hypothetical protein COW78_14700 [Bdellovibrio sp. CG22_combo_CG10-13_8_21_14_all_39_27]PIQ61473.1 MAG: hypothetical protein COW00_03735 [Bdellovibrio sp. CG12_big_fil_rev_8_21_14_0_65_39_13]PIR35319.1 MAG: hypothetical protein COV37_09500 [Bdellovibrio sp. CG11_big_fil_rev_8_21_14_0_20_39_38]PJB53651.1 MAG: hypothetical protein CO099_05950 [Bdellovibrio sp. CG_4_9_14_3_um_filter_39_7]
MHLFGELRDFSLAQKIQMELQQKGMQVELVRDDVHGVARLFVRDQKDQEAAFHYYRVKLGLPAPPPKVDEDWQKLMKVPLGEMTRGLIILSLAITIALFFDEKIANWFYFNRLEDAPFESIMRGELWRLWTPIFMHFGILHILFNLMWLKDLGSVFESKYGPLFLLTFVSIVGAASNISQYLVGGPRFGGMSGVVYGLLGLLWVLPKMRDDFEYKLPKRDTTLMIAWFFLCLTGVFGPIANMAHAVGASGGILFALFLGMVKKKPPLSLFIRFFIMATVLPPLTFVLEVFVKSFK